MTTATTGRPPDPDIERYVEQILSMKVDSSVFVPDATREQLEFLRKPVTKAGANIEIIQTTNDEIYGTPGVRLYRRNGEYDEL